MINKNNKGQIFSSLIVFFLAFLIFIFAVPMMFTFISQTLALSVGTATAFVIKIFLGIIMLVFIAVFLKLVTGDGGFFTR